MNIKIKAYALLLTVLFLLPFAACSSDAGVSSACIGYAAGENEPSLSWQAGDVFVPPIEFLRAAAILYALEKDEALGEEELPYRLVYTYDDTYMTALLQRLSTDPDRMLAALNEYAKALGMTGTTFCSLTGIAENEHALRASFSLPEKEHRPNVTTLEDLYFLSRALYANPGTRALYAGYSMTFAGTSQEKTRNIPLLRPSSDQYLPDARMALGGWCRNDGSNRYVLASAIGSDGKTAFSVVAARTDNNDALLYAACDAGNLGGKCLGMNCRLEYLPASDPGRGGLNGGRGIFHTVILVILALALLLLLLLILAGVIVRVKRNREGRKKYLPPDGDNR